MSESTPLELPLPAELDALEEGLDETTAIQMAADLFTMATGVTDQPTDPMQQRIIKYAILEMAWALTVRHEDMEAIFSPFSGERIGSYSYTKAINAVATGSKTGVPMFDRAVAYFNLLGRSANPNVTSEWVFKQGEKWAANLRHNDPFNFGDASWNNSQDPSKFGVCWEDPTTETI